MSIPMKNDLKNLILLKGMIVHSIWADVSIKVKFRWSNNDIIVYGCARRQTVAILLRTISIIQTVEESQLHHFCFNCSSAFEFGNATNERIITSFDSGKNSKVNIVNRQF